MKTVNECSIHQDMDSSALTSEASENIFPVWFCFIVSFVICIYSQYFFVAADTARKVKYVSEVM